MENFLATVLSGDSLFSSCFLFDLLYTTVRVLPPLWLQSFF